MRCREFSESGNFLGILEFFWDFWGIFWDVFGNFLGIFWEFFGNSLLNSLESYLNIEGINLFVKILVFIKISSQWRRKEEGKNLDP